MPFKIHGLADFVFLIWLLGIFLTVWGTAITLRHLRRRNFKSWSTPAPPITVIKPLCGNEAGLAENLLSFFRLEYPKYEILFCISSEQDPAFSIIRDLLAQHPFIPARLILSGERNGWVNPKVQNITPALDESQNEWILISDSNVRVSPDYLRALSAYLDENTGAVTAIISGQGESGLGGKLESLFLGTFYARAMNIASALKKPFVVGKTMCFQKSVINRFGGMKTLQRYLAEDYFAGEGFRYLKLEIRTMHEPVMQYLGHHSLRKFWSRHVRWGRIRKSQAPLVFWIEPWLTMIPSCLLGAWSGNILFGWGFANFFAVHTTVWSFCDWLLARKMGCPSGITFSPLWWIREILYLPLWVHIALGSSVNWRGQKLVLNPGGLLREPSEK